MSENMCICSKCGGVMMQGLIRQRDIAGVPVTLEFAIPGVRTSMNPFKAYKQGLAHEPEEKVQVFGELIGFRCQSCGYLDLYALSGDG